jgi:hypothetical protein
MEIIKNLPAPTRANIQCHRRTASSCERNVGSILFFIFGFFITEDEVAVKFSGWKAVITDYHYI